MSIEVNGVTKIYGKQKALNDVSFQINSGEIIGFIGPNGAGKSTMMKIITAYLTQSEGSIKICGKNVEKNSIEIRNLIGYLPENNPLYIDMYIKEYLEYVARIYKIKNKSKRVKELIELTGLEIEQHKKIQMLSKGYRQRVGLAQALIHNPEVLILDEPTTGLDPNQLVEFRNLIIEAGKDKTIMLSTHIMQEVEAMCDRVILIDQGKIIADNKSENLIKENEFKQQIYVEFKDEILQRNINIDSVEQIKRIDNKCYILYSNSNFDIRESAFKFAINQNLILLSLKEIKGNLEDTFNRLTKK